MMGRSVEGDSTRGSFVPKRCTPDDLQNIQNIHQLENWATKHVLAPSLAAFVNYGAEDEESIASNQRGFTRYYLRPRILRDVSSIDTSTTILQGSIKLSSPVCVAPFAGCRALHPDGENAVASAAARVGTIYTVPNWASIPLPTILESHCCQTNKKSGDTSNPSKQATSPLFFQLYPHKPPNPQEGIHREHMKALLEYLEATSSGKIVAVVVTCDTPNNGNREKTYKNAKWLVDINEEVGGFPMPCALKYANKLPQVNEEGHSAKMNWDDIIWMKQECKNHQMKLIVKGIMTAEDAVLAAKAGVDAIIISNHGGRQLDGTCGTVEVVEECARAVNDCTNKMMEIYVDGGIRRGKDVVKCLALGAKCVFVGRPILWGLAAGGEAGVVRALEILRNEFREVMQLIGCQSCTELSIEYVGKEGECIHKRITKTTPMQNNHSTQWFVPTVCVFSLAAFAFGRSMGSSSRRN